MHTIVLCNQPFTLTSFFHFASACKWTNTGNCHRFLWVFASFCPCSHTGSLHRVQLMFLFGVPVFLLKCLYHFRCSHLVFFWVLSEHLFSYPFVWVFCCRSSCSHIVCSGFCRSIRSLIVFFCCFFGESVLISFYSVFFWLPQHLFSYIFNMKQPARYWYYQYYNIYNTGNASIVNITILVIPVL